jgi:hypothetical protein
MTKDDGGNMQWNFCLRKYVRIVFDGEVKKSLRTVFGQDISSG